MVRRAHHERSCRGFTLMEVLVAVGLIALLASVALPSFLRARSTTSEVVAVASCQTIGKACQFFYSHSTPHTYPDGLPGLANAVPSYIDPALGSGQKVGYRFDYRLTDAERFELRAEPVEPGNTGNRWYYLDQTGVLRVRMGGPAGPADLPLEA